MQVNEVDSAPFGNNLLAARSTFLPWDMATASNGAIVAHAALC
jgi:hypothetical protein